MKKKSKELLNNTFLFFIGSIGSKFIQFILVPLYTYTLTTEQYGITELILTAINFLIPIFSISIADAYLRFGLNRKYNSDDVTKNTLNVVFFGTILSFLCIPLFKINSIISTWLFYFIIILNLRVYRDVFSIRLKILEKNKLFAIDSIIYTFILCICSILFLSYFKMEIQGYFLSYIIANIFSILFILIISKFKIKIIFNKSDKKMLKEMIKYSIPMVANGMAWWITNASDRFMLDWMMSSSDVGIYSVAAKIPSLITTFTGVFNQAWIISSVVEYDSEREMTFYSETFAKYIGLLFVSSSGLLLILKPFMSIYVSNNFVEAWQFAPLLITSAISSGIAAFTVGIYSAAMKNINVTVTTVLGGIINIILNFLLIPRFGIEGAAISTYFSWMLIAIIRLIDIKKFFDFNVNFKKVTLYLFLNLLQALVLIYANYLISTIFSLAIVVIALSLERKLIIDIFISMIIKVKRGGRQYEKSKKKNQKNFEI